jgi:hypothetical protein
VAAHSDAIMWLAGLTKTRSRLPRLSATSPPIVTKAARDFTAAVGKATFGQLPAGSLGSMMAIYGHCVRLLSWITARDDGFRPALHGRPIGRFGVFLDSL